MTQAIYWFGAVSLGFGLGFLLWGHQRCRFALDLELAYSKLWTALSESHTKTEDTLERVENTLGVVEEKIRELTELEARLKAKD
jgi:type II secretory pathway component PulM